MCKVCRNCSVAKRELGESSAEYDLWFEGHRKNCDVNHYGSSTSMEMEAALIFWERSQEKGFCYSTLLSDGDFKAKKQLSRFGVDLESPVTDLLHDIWCARIESSSKAQITALFE
ncbi:uncharacterized protein TNCV_3571301 [Trichonephila clavipes]|nr:uncharacterized protein TNCV_3571301 [Trichonephila clavipes]